MTESRPETARAHRAQRAGMEVHFNRALAERIRNRRVALDMTQDELAVLAGLSRGSIANIERAQQMPQVFRLFLIARSLRTSVASLLPDEELSMESIVDTLTDEHALAVESVRRTVARAKAKSQR